MTLPTYDKSKRKQSAFIQLPKGAYVIVIKGVKEESWPSGDRYLSIAFDIAEGEYKGLYQSQFDKDTRADKRWNYNAVYRLGIPTDSSQALELRRSLQARHSDRFFRAVDLGRMEHVLCGFRGQ